MRPWQNMTDQPWTDKGIPINIICPRLLVIDGASPSATNQRRCLDSWAWHCIVQWVPWFGGIAGCLTFCPGHGHHRQLVFFSQGYLDTRSTSASTLYIDIYIYVCVYPHVSLSNACNYVVAWCCLLFLSWFIHIEVTNQAWTTGTHISNLYKWISVDVKGTVVNSFMPPNCTGTHDLW